MFGAYVWIGYLSYFGWEKELVGWGFALRVDTKDKERDRLFTIVNPPEGSALCSLFRCFNT